MKKTIILAVAALMLLSAQCKKNEQKPGSQEDMVMVPITGTVTFGGGTKTDITTWGHITPVDGDKIWIYYGGLYKGYMTCRPTTGQQFNCAGEIDENCLGKECVFMYLGTGSKEADGSTDISVTSSNISFANQSGITVSGDYITGLDKFHVGSCSAMVSTDGIVTLPMRTKMAIAYFQLTDDSDPTVPIANADVTISGHYSSATINKTDGTLSGNTSGDITVKTDAQGCFYMALIPQSGAVTFSFAGGGKEATNTFPYGIKANTYYSNQGNTSPIVVTMVEPETDEGINFNDPAMGVTGMPIWSMKNLGATCSTAKSTDSETATTWYGDYYAWGEVAPYYTGITSGSVTGWKDGKTAGYDWGSYRWCMGSETSLTKYNTNEFYGYEFFLDDKTELEDADDAAYQNATPAHTWRMPADVEWLALYNSTLWVWTTSYSGISNLKGYVVYKVKNTADKGVRASSNYPASGANTNNGGVTVDSRTYSVDTGDADYQPHMFLPAAGYFSGTSLDYAGFEGGYWSASLNSEEPFGAWFMHFDSESVSPDAIHYRCNGLAVRPVQ